MPRFADAARLDISHAAAVADLAESVVRGAATSPCTDRSWSNSTDSTRSATPLTGALSTMGRDFDGDPAYFLASAAAGRHAASLLERGPERDSGVNRTE